MKLYSLYSFCAVVGVGKVTPGFLGMTRCETWVWPKGENTPLFKRRCQGLCALHWDPDRILTLLSLRDSIGSWSSSLYIRTL
jgi:hypothetical protein